MEEKRGTGGKWEEKRGGKGGIENGQKERAEEGSREGRRKEKPAVGL